MTTLADIARYYQTGWRLERMRVTCHVEVIDRGPKTMNPRYLVIVRREMWGPSIANPEDNNYHAAVAEAYKRWMEKQ